MIVFEASNVNIALPQALHSLSALGHERGSRNGPVLAFQQPVTTMYRNPTERVLFSPMRNANPTFHLLESLWMLAGRNDVKFPATFVKNMKSFTDDGETFWGAYGYRWRHFFGWDQIDAAIQELKANPESRRVVIGMWNPMDQKVVASFEKRTPPDFEVGQNGGKDVPCNTHIYLDLRDGRLNMTVCCRSNDILWGCYGANAVHMSILQEYIALSIGVPVGVYYQMSNDLHLYTSKIPEQGLHALAQDCLDFNYYDQGVKPVALWHEGESKEDFDQDLHHMFAAFDHGGYSEILKAQFETDFFNFTVRSMLQAWAYRKTPGPAMSAADGIAALDWHLAMKSWLETNQHSFGGA